MPINWKIRPNNKRNQVGLTSVTSNSSDLYNVWQALGSKGVWGDEWPKLIDPKQTPIQSIKIRKVVVRAGGAIDGIQFFYSVESGGKRYEVDGVKMGGNGGNEYTVNFGEDEYLLKMRGNYNNSSLAYIEFFSFNTTTKNVNPSQWYGNNSNGTNWFTVSIPTITGNNRTNNNLVAGFDFFEGDVIDENENKLNQAQPENLKMFLLLQRNKNIQQLKEELKDKVLLANSKKELLEKWKQYPLSILLFQSQHKGEYSVLFINKEKQKAISYCFINGDDWKNKTTQEINSFLNPTGLKVEYLLNWGSSTNPNSDLELSGFTATALIELLLNKIKKGEQYNLGDNKANQGANNYVYDWNDPDWPKEQQSQLKKDYDNITNEDIVNEFLNLQSNQEKHTDKDLEQHKPEDLKPTDLPTDWKDQLAKIPTLEANQKKTEKERDALKTSVTDKEKIITQRDDYIKKQEAIITEKDATIAKLVQLVKETGDNDKLQALQVVASGNK